MDRGVGAPEESSSSSSAADDVAERIGMALDRLRALQKREGDYYGTKVAVRAPPRSPGQQRRRRSPRLATASCEEKGTIADGGRARAHEQRRGGGRSARRAASSAGDEKIEAAVLARFRYRATFGKAWWATISSWAYEVVDYFDLPRGTVAWMMHYMDRVLSQRASSDDDDGACDPSNNEFMLLSVAALYLAMKLTCCGAPAGIASSSSWPAGCPGGGGGGTRSGYGGPPPRRLPLAVFLELSKHRFTARQVSGTELHILQSLEWRVHPPTPDQYVPDLVDVCCGTGPSRGDVCDCALYLIELSVINPYFLDFLPSEIAVAAMGNAQHLTMRRAGQKGASLDENNDDGGGHDKDDVADDGACVVLPARSPAAFGIDPLQVLKGVDQLRVAWCRIRLTEMIDKQRQMRQEYAGHDLSNTHPCGEASGTRTSSPVSVVPPKDEANANEDLGVAGPVMNGLVETQGSTHDPGSSENICEGHSS